MPPSPIRNRDLRIAVGMIMFWQQFLECAFWQKRAANPEESGIFKGLQHKVIERASCGGRYVPDCSVCHFLGGDRNAAHAFFQIQNFRNDFRAPPFGGKLYRVNLRGIGIKKMSGRRGTFYEFPAFLHAQRAYATPAVAVVRQPFPCAQVRSAAFFNTTGRKVSHRIKKRPSADGLFDGKIMLFPLCRISGRQYKRASSVRRRLPYISRS